MRITKVKYDAAKMRIEYEQERDGGEPDQFSLSCSDQPVPEFLAALAALIADVIEICELPPDYAKGMKVRGVSISWTNDVMGACVGRGAHVGSDDGGDEIGGAMQLRSFRERLTAGQLRRRNAHVARRKSAGHIYYDPAEFAVSKPKKLRRYTLSFAALRDRLFRREQRLERKRAQKAAA